jgi:cob(I)alamin adenosyltransferase
MKKILLAYFSIISLFLIDASSGNAARLKKFSEIDDAVLSMYEDTLIQTQEHTSLLQGIKSELASLKSQMAHSTRENQKINAKIFELLKSQIKVLEKLTHELKELTVGQPLEASKK